MIETSKNNKYLVSLATPLAKLSLNVTHFNKSLTTEDISSTIYSPFERVGQKNIAINPTSQSIESH